MSRFTRSDRVPYEGAGREFSSSMRFASTGPSPVQVRGVNGENLGPGRVIGVLHLKDDSKSKVIAIDEPTIPSGQVELLASECSYGRFDDTDVERWAAHPSSIMSPLDYLAGCLHKVIQPPLETESG